MRIPYSAVLFFAFGLAAPTAHLNAQPLTPYGTATPGAGSIAPRIWANGEPRLGNSSFAITVDRGVGGAPSAVVLGTNTAAIPVLGATLLIDPGQTPFAVTHAIALGGAIGVPGAGTAALSLPIPTLAALEGVSFLTQWLIVDSAVAPSVAASDGLRVTIRRQPAFMGVLPQGLETIETPGASGVRPWSTAAIGGRVALSGDGTLAIAALFNPANEVVEAYDATAVPAVSLGKFTVPANRLPRAFVVHPRGPRAYAVLFNAAGYFEVWSYDVDRGSPTFGQPLQRMRILDLLAGTPTISADGRRLAVAWATGDISGSYISIFDVDPTSPTRDQWLRDLRMLASGLSVFDVQLAPDASTFFAADRFISPLTQFDTVTGKTIASTPLPAGNLGMRIDPRGRSLVVRSGSIFGPLPMLVVVDLEPGPGFFGTRTINTTAPAEGLQVSADGSAIAISIGGCYELWDVAAGTRISRTVSAGDIHHFVLR